MSDPPRPSFWAELRQRRVVRAVTVYAVAAWVAVQVADVFFPALRLPEWTVSLVAALALLGFPVTVALAWIYDRTAEGLRRTPDEGGEERGRGRAEGLTGGLGLRFASALVLGVVLGAAVVGAGVWFAPVSLGLGGDRTGADTPVLAVLPFETMGEANPTFTEGIHGDILTRLSGITGLDVISRTSVLRYRDERLQSPGRVAEELGAGWVLRGEVQQVGERVQVSARLVDARRDRQVWAESFLRDLTTSNLFDIQREITLRIAAALEDRLQGGGGAGMDAPGTPDLEAYRLYVQGRGLLGSREEDPMRRAVAFFQRAIARDSAYAAAWAGLADAVTYLETFGYDTPAGTMDPATAANRALQLDPGLAEAHFALANLAHADRDNSEAIRQAERAIELRPSYSDAFNLLSWMHKQNGQLELAAETAERAVDLDPLGSAPLSNLALASLARGNLESARTEAARLVDLHPSFATGPFIAGLALYHEGRFEEAAAQVAGAEVAWAGAGPLALEALARLALGDTTAAHEALGELDRTADPFSHALLRLALGDAVAGEEILALERWEYWPTLAIRYLFPGVLGQVRRDPRYDGLVERVDRSWGFTGPS